MVENKTDAKFLNELVTKVLRKSIGINNDVVIEDWDLDRVYLKINDNEATIRMWNVFDNGKNSIKVQWTLFTIVDDLGGSSHGEELGCGVSVVNTKEGLNDNM